MTDLWSDKQIHAAMRTYAWPYTGAAQALYVDQALRIAGQVRDYYAALLAQSQAENAALQMRCERLQAQVDGGCA